MKNIPLLLIAAFMLFGCQKTMQESWNYYPKSVNLDNYNNLEFIKIKQGNTITLNISENLSTGYFWSTESQKDCSISINDGDYIQSEVPDGMVGVGGTRTYTVSGKNKGSCMVEFTKARSSGDIAETKAIYFVVD